MSSSGALEGEPAPRILIVEDERIVAMDLAGTLAELGYAVAGMAARGEDAIEQAKRLNPNLILMDVRLAGKMDGIQAAQSIREERDVPVVYLTAHSDNETLQRAANTTASGYLVKPFKITRAPLRHRDRAAQACGGCADARERTVALDHTPVDRRRCDRHRRVGPRAPVQPRRRATHGLAAR